MSLLLNPVKNDNFFCLAKLVFMLLLTCNSALSEIILVIRCGSLQLLVESHTEMNLQNVYLLILYKKAYVNLLHQYQVV